MPPPSTSLGGVLLTVWMPLDWVPLGKRKTIMLASSFWTIVSPGSLKDIIQWVVRVARLCLVRQSLPEWDRRLAFHNANLESHLISSAQWASILSSDRRDRAPRRQSQHCCFYPSFLPPSPLMGLKSSSLSPSQRIASSPMSWNRLPKVYPHWESLWNIVTSNPIKKHRRDMVSTAPASATDWKNLVFRSHSLNHLIFRLVLPQNFLHQQKLIQLVRYFLFFHEKVHRSMFDFTLNILPLRLHEFQPLVQPFKCTFVPSCQLRFNPVRLV